VSVFLIARTACRIRIKTMYFQDILIKNWNLLFSIFSLIILFLLVTVLFFLLQKLIVPHACVLVSAHL
jgi:hypothetical protein